MKSIELETVIPELPAFQAGTVFDIQRCSLQDGPGIRTTVFLKGCPLRCQWCHNPESMAAKPQISYDASRCVSCLKCVEVCPTHTHVADEFGKHQVNFRRCNACGQCVETCSKDALRLIGEVKSVGEVMDVILRDRAYYQNSGGGMTLSGGEPMAQFDFSLALLKASRDAGIHTCVETSGAAGWHRYEEALPWTDLFLFDYKVTDPDLHRELVGISNVPIRRNLDRLMESGAQVILRCPLIPGVNDSDDHLQGIAALVAKHPTLLGVEIMPYHNLGIPKATHLGMTSPLATVEPPTAQQQSAWLTCLHELGCTSVRIS